MKKTIHTMRHAHLRSVLRDVRVTAGLTQVELAARLQVPQAIISNYERGERRLDLVELSDICDAVGISLVDFVRKYQASLATEP